MKGVSEMIRTFVPNPMPILILVLVGTMVVSSINYWYPQDEKSATKIVMVAEKGQV